MTQAEYAEFERRVAAFFKRHGINCLSREGDEGWFSHRRCDCCDRPLGGDRFQASGFNPEDKQVYTFEVCEDCLYYAQYGQLDDMTMMDMCQEKDKEESIKETFPGIKTYRLKPWK